MHVSRLKHLKMHCCFHTACGTIPTWFCKQKFTNMSRIEWTVAYHLCNFSQCGFAQIHYMNAEICAYLQTNLCLHVSMMLCSTVWCRTYSCGHMHCKHQHYHTQCEQGSSHSTNAVYDKNYKLQIMVGGIMPLYTPLHRLENKGS